MVRYSLLFIIIITILFGSLFSKETEKDKVISKNYALITQNYLERGDVKASIKYLNKALLLDKENHTYQYMLAKNYLFVGDYKNAEKYLNKVWKHLASTEFFSTYYIENTSYKDQRKFYLVAYFKAFLDYINKRYSTKIMIALSNEITRNPLFPDAHFLYGCTALQDGSKRIAIREFKKVLEIDPQFTSVKEKLNEINNNKDISQVSHCDISILLKSVRPISECLSIGEYYSHTKNKNLSSEILKCKDSAEKYRLLTIAYFREGKHENKKEKAREFFIKAKNAFFKYKKLTNNPDLFVYMIALENSIILDHEKKAYIHQRFIIATWPTVWEAYYLYANYITGGTNSRLYFKSPDCDQGRDYFNKAFLLNKSLKPPKSFNIKCGIWKQPKKNK